LVSWEWDLDNDGQYDDATGETVDWSICSPGIHVIGLKVTNNYGEYDAVDTVFSVTSNVPNSWTINKAGDQTDLILSIGQMFMVNYEIGLDETSNGNGIDECVNVFDDFSSFMGTVCDDQTFAYSQWVGPYGSCGDYTVENTATCVANDTGSSDSQIWTVNVQVPCVFGCTLSHGYWKTHSSYGPAPYHDTWASLGEDTQFFLSGQSYHEVLWTAPQGGNAYYILAHQYIAAELNVLNGASMPVEVVDAKNEAQNLLNTYTPSEMAALRGRVGRETREQVLALAETFDNYNNGVIGPGHCSE
jgi:PKD repeat protein